jgi:triosephosphate isomerase
LNRKLIAGNWKMNLGRDTAASLTRALAHGLAKDPAAEIDVLVCPPAILIGAAVEARGHAAIAVGGQDCHAAASGAHTGDIAAEMLADCGATYVIVGHSERRQDHGETDAVVRAKAAAAHRAGLVAIICIGETEAERLDGRALAICSGQIEGSVPPGGDALDTVIAYEPVWAIGTGRTPTVADVAEMHAHIRAELAGRVADCAAVRILYGGSVKPSNAAELLAIADVDGALVGGASLVAADFLAIVEAARKATVA